MRMTITTPTLPPTISPTDEPEWVVLLIIPREFDALGGTHTFVLVVKTDVPARAAVFALVCTIDVELFTVGLLEDFSSDTVMGSMEA